MTVQETQDLIVEYSRNEDRYWTSRCFEHVETKTPQGYVASLLGGVYNRMMPYNTTRHTFSPPDGNMAMRNRAVIALRILRDPKVWDSHCTTTEQSLDSVIRRPSWLRRMWDKIIGRKVNNHWLQDLLYRAAIKIQVDTGGVILPGKIRVLVNPVTAKKLVMLPEVRRHIREHMSRTPSVIYGFPFEVCEEVETGGGNNRYVLPDDMIILVSRGPDMMLPLGHPSHSTGQFFFYEEMVVNEHKVCENFDFMLSYPLSGFMIKV